MNCKHQGEYTGVKVGGCRKESVCKCNHPEVTTNCLPQIAQKCNKNALKRQSDKSKFRGMVVCANCPFRELLEKK